MVWQNRARRRSRLNPRRAGFYTGGEHVANLQADLAKLEKSPQDLARWKRRRAAIACGPRQPARPRYHDLVKRFPMIVNLWFEVGAAAAADLDFALAREAFAHAEALAFRGLERAHCAGPAISPPPPAGPRPRLFRSGRLLAAPSSSHARLSWAAWLRNVNAASTKPGSKPRGVPDAKSRDTAALLVIDAFLPSSEKGCD